MTTTVDADVAAARRTRRITVALAWTLAVAWVVLPTLRAVFVLVNGAEGMDYPTAADVPALEVQSVFGGATFLALGILTIALAVAVRRLQPASSGPGTGALIAGATAGIGLVFAGVQGRTMYSWISANLGEAASDHDVQAAAFWVLNIVSSTGLFVAAVATAAWTLLTTIDGRALARGWGWAASVVAIVFAGAAWGLVLPAAQYLCGPLFVLVAIGLTRSRRR
ncbi:hypothetical protein IF188_11060 [Microbacterium sp. NEAU-LLC]|uniref:DUF4386 domain-containing protein n=1 Tax=Microbacterium helvum TaxID=2773713 RepID=A0ABR8NNK2_9MICO|nr:hypothetical protein [Microbacterium helvum]MBD3942235.1 hypothetical protein [Microbacterium helvum]